MGDFPISTKKPIPAPARNLLLESLNRTNWASARAMGPQAQIDFARAIYCAGRPV